MREPRLSFPDYALRILFITTVGLLLLQGVKVADKWVDFKISQSTPQVEEVAAPVTQFEVLLTSKNKEGGTIHAFLTVNDEDIPRFMEGHTWRVLPPNSK